jgi:hypothetical protein
MVGAQQPTLAELALDGGSVSLGGAAAEIFYVKAGHWFLRLPLEIVSS